VAGRPNVRVQGGEAVVRTPGRRIIAQAGKIRKRVTGTETGEIGCAGEQGGGFGWGHAVAGSAVRVKAASGFKS
jgi:hypothetical protein